VTKSYFRLLDLAISLRDQSGFVGEAGPVDHAKKSGRREAAIFSKDSAIDGVQCSTAPKRADV
jgi:hypothetical protein